MQADPRVIEETYAAKARQRAALARLPLEEKIVRLVRLQERARDFCNATGRKAPMVWKLPSAPSTS